MLIFVNNYKNLNGVGISVHRKWHFATTGGNSGGSAGARATARGVDRGGERARRPRTREDTPHTREDTPPPHSTVVHGLITLDYG